VQGCGCGISASQSQVAEHIEGNTVFTMTVSSDTVHAFLHFSVTPVAAFHGIRRRRQQLVVQKLQALLQRRRIQLRDRPWIKLRAVGRDAVKFQLAIFQDTLERAEQLADVLMFGIMVENAIRQTFVFAIVNNRKHAKRAVINFIDRGVAGKVCERPIEILASFDSPSEADRPKAGRQLRCNGTLPRCLDSFLNRCERHEHAMITPQMPTRLTI